MLCLRLLRPRRNTPSAGRENNNERSSRDEALEDSIGGEGEIIAEASIATEREVGEDDTEIKPEDVTDVNQTDGLASASVARSPSDVEEGERRQEEREALRTLDEALGRDAISEGGSSIMEPSSSTVAVLLQPESEEKLEAGVSLGKVAETPKEVTENTATTEAVAGSDSLVVSDKAATKDENDKVATKYENDKAATKDENDKVSEEEAKESDHSSVLLKQNSEESSLKENAPSSPMDVTATATSDPILSDEFRGMRLKSDDNSSLGEISVDPRLDTGSSLDGLIPPESPVGIDAMEGAGSDEDSDYPEERQLLNAGQDAGFGKVSTFLTGKKYTGAQVTPRAGDVTFRKNVPDENVAQQVSNRNASPLEMIISSKMATDTQEELVTALNKVRTLQAKVTDVEGDVNEAQSYAIEARKEAMEAKDEAIKAKQQAAEAMAEALEAKKDASLKRQEIQAISGSSSHITDNHQEQNALSHGIEEAESLGFIPSVTPDDLSSIALGSHPDVRRETSSVVNTVSSVTVDNVTSVSNAVEHGVGAVGSEARSLAQQGNVITGKLEDGLQEGLHDTRMAAASLKSGLSFSSIWGGFLVRLCLLLVTIGASGHLIVAILKTIDDESYIKLGVYAFILACIFLPAACLAIYLLVKSNVSRLYKATRELNAARKPVHPPLSTVTFSDHVVELPPLNHHDPDDGLEEISLGSRTSERDTAPIGGTRAADALQDTGTLNPAFENNVNV